MDVLRPGQGPTLSLAPAELTADARKPLSRLSKMISDAAFSGFPRRSGHCPNVRVAELSDTSGRLTQEQCHVNGAATATA